MWFSVMLVRSESDFHGATDAVTRPHAGCFAWVDGAPAEGYRAARTTTGGCGTSEPIGPGVPSGGTSGPIGPGVPVRLGRRRPAPDAPVGVLTGPYGAQVLAPLLAGVERDDVRLVEVPNRFFGGNIGVTGLMVGEDIDRGLADQQIGSASGRERVGQCG